MSPTKMNAISGVLYGIDKVFVCPAENAAVFLAKKIMPEKSDLLDFTVKSTDKLFAYELKHLTEYEIDLALPLNYYHQKNYGTFK